VQPRLDCAGMPALTIPNGGAGNPRQDGPLVPLAGAAAIVSVSLIAAFRLALSAVFATPSATGIGSRIRFGVATAITQMDHGGYGCRRLCAPRYANFQLLTSSMAATIGGGVLLVRHSLLVSLCSVRSAQALQAKLEVIGSAKRLTSIDVREPDK
jgi:hypothetical protein